MDQPDTISPNTGSSPRYKARRYITQGFCPFYAIVFIFVFGAIVPAGVSHLHTIRAVMIFIQNLCTGLRNTSIIVGIGVHYSCIAQMIFDGGPKVGTVGL